MARTIRPPVPELPLQRWYASEGAKRSFGSICQRVNESGGSVDLLGTPERPLLVLGDADSIEPAPDEVLISIDEAKAEWPAVTTAASIFGTRFRVRGRKTMRAVLYRHPTNRHPAERYRRSQSVDMERIAAELERLANDVRRLRGENPTRGSRGGRQGNPNPT
jgi:hypothetical protein